MNILNPKIFDNVKTVEEIQARLESYKDAVKDEIDLIGRAYGADIRSNYGSIYYHFESFGLRDEFVEQVRKYCTFWIGMDHPSACLREYQ